MISYGIQPSEYWKLSPNEVALIIDANKPPLMIAGLNENDLDSLVDMHDKGGFI